MFGQPKRNAKCQLCGRRGACSCRRRMNAELERKPDSVTTCTRTCGWSGKDKSCGRTARNGVCPCPNC